MPALSHLGSVPPRRQAHFTAGLIGLACLIATGCTTTYQVQIDAISQDTPVEAQSFRIRPKDAATDPEDLRYKEVEGYVKTALSGRGLYEAPNYESADMIIDVDYGMERPRVKMETYSTPVMATMGGGVRYVTVPVRQPNGTITTRTVAVFEPPRTEVVGFQEVNRPTLVYEKYLRISARENASPTEGAPPAQLWSVNVTQEDTSNDLRAALPILASATIDHIGTNTGTQRTVKVKETDDAVDFIRRGM